MDTTSPQYKFIDCDTHLTEPPDVWTSRVAKKWALAAPHVRFIEEDQKEYWFIGDKRLTAAGASAHAGGAEPFPGHPPTIKQAHPAAYESHARIKYMDSVGCRAQVVYPNIGGFGSQAFLGMGDPELMLACVKAYNDFQLDWMSADRSRFIPVMATPFWDVDASVKEVERCAKLGYKGILFTAAPQDYGFPVFGDHHWDPFWSVAQEAEM